MQALFLSHAINVAKQTKFLLPDSATLTGRRGPGAYDINTRVALGAIDSGIGYTHVNSFFTTLNVPTINRRAYKRRERKIGLAVEEVAANSCRMALQDEIDIEKSHGKTPDPDGLFVTSLYFI